MQDLLPESPEPPLAALKRWFGFDSFRPGQESIVRDALAGVSVPVKEKVSLLNYRKIK